MENTSTPDELQQVTGDSSQQEYVESKHVLDEKEGSKKHLPVNGGHQDPKQEKEGRAKHISTRNDDSSPNLNFGEREKLKRGRPKANTHVSRSNDRGRQIVLALPAQVPPNVVRPIHLTISGGEDVFVAIVSAFQQCNHFVSILYAFGTVSSVKLGGKAPDVAVEHRGSYRIISLSGSYVPSRKGAPHSNTSQLMTALARMDGTVFGGRVIGPLIAEAGVQVVLGRFNNVTHI